MADEMDFESFDNLGDLDWSEMEKDVKDKGGAEPGAAGGGFAAPPAHGGGMSAPVKASSSAVDIQYLMDVDLEIVAEVGRKLAYISDILSWDRGSIVELDKIVGEPLNLLINGKKVARGEVVIINEKFAVKITDILNPNDRMTFL